MRGYPHWAAFYGDDLCFMVVVDDDFRTRLLRQPPTSAQATELLIEFCCLREFSPRKGKRAKSEPLMPYTAAFLAALAVPSGRWNGLIPKFHVPIVKKRRVPLSREAFLQSASTRRTFHIT